MIDPCDTKDEIKQEIPIPVPDSSEDEVDCEDLLDEKNSLLKISSYSINEFRLIKQAIEDAIQRKVRHMDKLENPLDKEKYVCYYRNFAIDKVGNMIKLGETGIAEGWNVPIYENEFKNLLGLPFHEDNALAETLRIKKPRMECFNCLATNHRVNDCPVKIDEERIKIHKKIFTNQSLQAQEQAELYSTRYTSDLDSKENRGFVPGKISDQLREALGIRQNQLPPYIYLMRELGYPIGWLMEAQVKQPKLAVHDGNNQDSADKENVTEKSQEINEVIEYDPDKIYAFPGFNENPSRDIIDESEKYGVERYSERLSREKFLGTLNLKKRKIVRRSTMSKATDTQTEESDLEEMETSMVAANEKSTESLEDGLIKEIDDQQDKEGQVESSKKTKKLQAVEKIGTSFTEILGTPVLSNATDEKSVPNWEKFSENICEHRSFEMESNTPTGNYQNIVRLTREFKTASFGPNQEKS